MVKLEHNIIKDLMNPCGRGMIYPYLLIDNAYINEDKYEIIVTKCISCNDVIFDLLPNNKRIFPKILLGEIAAQGSFLLNEYHIENSKDYKINRDFFLAAINKIVFNRNIFPGEILETRIWEIRFLYPYNKVGFESIIDNEIVASGIITSMEAPIIRNNEVIL